MNAAVSKTVSTASLVCGDVVASVASVVQTAIMIVVEMLKYP